MLVDCSSSEKKNFLSQAEAYLIPGYTGHCPTLKFRIGKRYGASTNEIMKDLSKYGVLNRNLKLLDNYQHYSVLESFPKIDLNTRAIQRSNKENKNIQVQQQCRKYILGYTGYIPGMYYRYGKPFCDIAAECEKEFLSRRTLHSNSQNAGKTKFSRDLNKNNVKILKTIAEKTNRSTDDNRCDRKICPEYPPISGYTGHIPLLKVSNLSVSQPYRNAAKIGLSTVKRKESSYVQKTNVDR